MKNAIKEIFLSFGSDLCGVANIDRFDNAPKGFSIDSMKKQYNILLNYWKGKSKPGLHEAPEKLCVAIRDSLNLIVINRFQDSI